MRGTATIKIPGEYYSGNSGAPFCDRTGTEGVRGFCPANGQTPGGITKSIRRQKNAGHCAFRRGRTRIASIQRVARLESAGCNSRAVPRDYSQRPGRLVGPPPFPMHPTTRLFLRRLPLLLAALLLTSAPAETMDEFTREVARYELTMPNLEAYGAAMAGLAEWAAGKPAEAAALQQRAPKGPTTYPQTLAYIEREPVLAALLKQHRLITRDFVLLLPAVMQAQLAVLGEAQGRTFPADRINPRNTAVVRANEKRVGEIMTKVAADRGRAFGR